MSVGTSLTRIDIHLQSRFGVPSKLFKQSDDDRSLTARVIIILSPLDSFKLNIRSIDKFERRSSGMRGGNEISQSRCESYCQLVSLKWITPMEPTLHWDIESISDLRNVTFGQSSKMGVDGPRHLLSTLISLGIGLSGRSKE